MCVLGEDGETGERGEVNSETGLRQRNRLSTDCSPHGALHPAGLAERIRINASCLRQSDDKSPDQ